MRLSFVLPCYNSQSTIKDVCVGICHWMDTHPQYDYEIVCINDASPDDVGQVLNSLAASDHKIKVLELAQNRGKHAAMMAGFSVSTGDLIVNLDDDGQCPIERLQLLLDAIEKGADIAMAKYPQKKQSWFKNFGSSINRKMSKILIGQAEDLDITNFSVMQRFVVDEILRYTNPYPYMGGLMVRATKHISSVEMTQLERLSGTSGYTFIKSIKLFLDGFTAFSVKPLRVATILGLGCATAGFLFGLWVIIHKILNPLTPAGYSSLMAVILFIGGMLMLMLGLVGEYIGRIYISINNSPQYVIRKAINVDTEQEEGNGVKH